ncbi:MAG: ABC transporter permease [Thermoplasmatota archaeon]
MSDPSFAKQAKWAISDTLLLTWRNLVHYVRVPQLIAFAVVQPIMFTLLFAFVFGGAIKTPNGNYVDFLIPGIIVQTVIFGSMQSGINIAEDTQKGIMDRFRALPIARGTVLAARTLSDTLRHTVSVFIMAGVGYLIGYRFHGALGDAALALGLCILIGLAFSWIATTIGLMVRDTQTAEIAGFTWVFPVVFASSIFVPVATMPTWLQWFALNSPITESADAVRAWSLGTPVGDAPLYAIAWCLALILIFGSIAVWRFRRLA